MAEAAGRNESKKRPREAEAGKERAEKAPRPTRSLHERLYDLLRSKCDCVAVLADFKCYAALDRLRETFGHVESLCALADGVNPDAAGSLTSGAVAPGTRIASDAIAPPSTRDPGACVVTLLKERLSGFEDDAGAWSEFADRFLNWALNRDRGREPHVPAGLAAPFYVLADRLSMKDLTHGRVLQWKGTPRRLRLRYFSTRVDKIHFDPDANSVGASDRDDVVWLSGVDLTRYHRVEFPRVCFVPRKLPAGSTTAPRGGGRRLVVDYPYREFPGEVDWRFLDFGFEATPPLGPPDKDERAAWILPRFVDFDPWTGDAVVHFFKGPSLRFRGRPWVGAEVPNVALLCFQRYLCLRYGVHHDHEEVEFPAEAEDEEGEEKKAAADPRSGAPGPDALDESPCVREYAAAETLRAPSNLAPADPAAEEYFEILVGNREVVLRSEVIRAVCDGFDPEHWVLPAAARWGISYPRHGVPPGRRLVRFVVPYEVYAGHGFWDEALVCLEAFLFGRHSSGDLVRLRLPLGILGRCMTLAPEILEEMERPCRSNPTFVCGLQTFGERLRIETEGDLHPCCPDRHDFDAGETVVVLHTPCHEPHRFPLPWVAVLRPKDRESPFEVVLDAADMRRVFGAYATLHLRLGYRRYCPSAIRFDVEAGVALLTYADGETMTQPLLEDSPRCFDVDDAIGRRLFGLYARAGNDFDAICDLYARPDTASTTFP